MVHVRGYASPRYFKFTVDSQKAIAGRHNDLLLRVVEGRR